MGWEAAAHLCLRERVDVVLVTRSVGQKAREEDKIEGRDEVVDALHVAARRVAQRPYVQDALERALHLGVPEELHRRRSARHVDEDLMEHLLVAVGAAVIGHVKVLRHRLVVLAPLALEHRVAPRAVGRQVAQQQLPRRGAALQRHARPRRGAQGLEVDDLRREERFELAQPLHLDRHRRRRRRRAARARGGSSGAAAAARTWRAAMFCRRI